MVNGARARLAQPLPLLLDPSSYAPDTIDLLLDHEMREYWLGAFETGLGRVAQFVLDAYGASERIRDRLGEFRSTFIAHLRRIRQEPGVYGPLTFRSLFDLRQQCLVDAGFGDAYAKGSQSRCRPRCQRPCQS